MIDAASRSGIPRTSGTTPLDPLARAFTRYKIMCCDVVDRMVSALDLSSPGLRAVLIPLVARALRECLSAARL